MGDHVEAMDYVARPADLGGFALRELAESYGMHVGALVNARHDIGKPAPIGRLRGDALDALAIGEQIARRMRDDRWVTVAEALTYGASVEMVGRALDLEPVDVADGLAAWARGQHEHASMSAEECDRVLALVEGETSA
jgi:hypothetical protein